MGVCREEEIRDKIIRWMDLWERGVHAGLVGDTEEEGAARDFRSSSGREEEDKAVVRSYHDTVLLGKLSQAVLRATNRERGWCLLQDDQCTKTGQLVAEVLIVPLFDR